ncbi:MAG: biotin--[acetyl-CoA-carboxylase] ligase [Thermovirgaceae bacterium]|nr:biotin--[acetyl-CoA-carboxylase] ligase [Synergistales bacterium]HRS48746.1 biotin--[acetyl-CoA-carboxylase] ligase [Thermovirgaceae bacterium]
MKTKIAVLSELMGARDLAVSGEALGLSLGLTRQAVWKAVKALKEDGYVIESIPRKGYRLVSTPENDLDPSLIETFLLDCPWGHPVLYWESLDSTQVPAKELARKGASEGLIVTTSYQTSGRGRLGRRWVSAPEGGVFFSLVTRPALPPASIQWLSLVSAMSVQDALSTLHGVKCQLKWPNDILWKDRKLCGILTEVSSEPGLVHFAVIGIGINANSSNISLGEGAETISLSSITGKKAHRGELIAGVVRYLHDAVRGLEAPGGIKRALADYTSRCDTLGRKVRVVSDEGEVIGEAIALGEKGEIIVRTKEGICSFTSADVNHLRALG